MINRVVAPLALGLALSLSASAQTTAPTKVGIINIQAALVGTKEGQVAQKSLQDRSAPKQKELERKKADIEAKRDQLNRLSNTGSEEQKQRLMRDVDTMTKSFNRDVEDAQTELDQEQGKVLNDLGGKMMQVIEKYARDNGYAVIIDVSSQQTPVVYASTSVDVTKDIVDLYDKNAPAPTSSAAPATAPTSGARPATTGVAPRPAGTTTPMTTPVKPAATKPATTR